MALGAIIMHKKMQKTQMLFCYILLDFQEGFLYNVSTIYVNWGRFRSVYIAIAISICAICKRIGLGLLTITEDYTITCVLRLCLRLRACALYRLTRSVAHTFLPLNRMAVTNIRREEIGRNDTHKNGRTKTVFVSGMRKTYGTLVASHY